MSQRIAEILKEIELEFDKADKDVNKSKLVRNLLELQELLEADPQISDQTWNSLGTKLRALALSGMVLVIASYDGGIVGR